MSPTNYKRCEKHIEIGVDINYYFKPILEWVHIISGNEKPMLVFVQMISKTVKPKLAWDQKNFRNWKTNIGFNINSFINLFI